MSLPRAARAVITLQLLEYFLVLAETLHYGRAAEQLYVSQPTLSRQIQRLESALGLELFSRDGRRVTLTHAGRVMQTHAAIIVEQSRLAGLALTGLDGGFSQLLEIGCFNSVHGSFMPRVLADFWRLYPEVAVRTTSLPSRDSVLRVREGLLDAAIVIAPPDLNRLEARPLFTERIIAIMPPDHPLSEGRAVQVKDLGGQTLITSAPGRNLRDLIDDALMESKVSAAALMEIQDVEAIKAFVRAGMGIGILGDTAIRDLDGAFDLTARPLLPALHRRISLVVQSQRREDPLLNELADIAMEIARRLELKTSN